MPKALFDPKVIERVIRENQGGPVDEVMNNIRAGLAAEYPGYILEDEEWILSVAGGVRGQICLLHASITEYILFFGTPIGTEGFSGRFPVDDWFWMFQGEQHCYDPGEHTKRVFTPESEVNFLKRGHGFFLKFTEGAYGVEYVRGFVPGMLPFGLADAFTSTLDATSIIDTFKIYTKGTVRSLLKGKI